jgi:hypothetical protein
MIRALWCTERDAQRAARARAFEVWAKVTGGGAAA